MINGRRNSPVVPIAEAKPKKRIGNDGAFPKCAAEPYARLDPHESVALAFGRGLEDLRSFQDPDVFPSPRPEFQRHHELRNCHGVLDEPPSGPALFVDPVQQPPSHILAMLSLIVLLRNLEQDKEALWWARYAKKTPTANAAHAKQLEELLASFE